MVLLCCKLSLHSKATWECVISVSHNSPFQPGIFLLPWLFWCSRTSRCWESCFESHSQRQHRLLCGWWQGKPELSVPSTGKNSSGMLHVSSTQPELKAPRLVKPPSVTESRFYSVARWLRGREEGSDLQRWRPQGIPCKQFILLPQKMLSLLAAALRIQRAVAESKVTAGSVCCFVTPGLGNTLCEIKFRLDVRKRERILSTARRDPNPACALTHIHTSHRFAVQPWSKVHWREFI